MFDRLREKCFCSKQRVGLFLARVEGGGFMAPKGGSGGHGLLALRCARRRTPLGCRVPKSVLAHVSEFLGLRACSTSRGDLVLSDEGAFLFTTESGNSYWRAVLNNLEVLREFRVHFLMREAVSELGSGGIRSSHDDRWLAGSDI